MQPRPINGAPAKRGGSSSSKWGHVVVWTMVVALGSALTWVYVRHGGKPTQADAETLCRSDVPPPSVVAVLLDVTDGLSATERMQVNNAIERIRAELPVGGRFDVFTLGEDGAVSARARISLCNPGDGSSMNRLYQNPELARRRWERDFKQRLDADLASVRDTDEAPQSPLLESIKSISLESLSPPALDGAAKTLVVVSDLLQHSGVVSHYQGPVSFDSLSKRPEYVSLRTELQGVDVQLFYIQRPATARLQGRQHLEFWLQFFDAEGASVSHVKKVSGDL